MEPEHAKGPAAAPAGAPDSTHGAREAETAQQRARIAHLREAFAKAADPSGKVDPAAMRRALRLKSEELAQKLFAMFDRDGSGTIEKDEFVDAIERVVFGSERDKLAFLFGFHDGDGDGHIARDELDHLIHLGLDENRLELPPALVQQMIDTLFHQADQNQDGRISFEEFAATLARYPEVLERVTRGQAVWSTLSNEALSEYRPERPSLAVRWAHLVEEHGVTAVFMVAYVALNVLLFVWAVHRYAAMGANGFVQLARGCGACLNFNGALILVPMMRRLLTWLRSTRAARFIPLDSSVAFHKLVGHVMFGFAVVHTVAHLANYMMRPEPWLELLLHTHAGLTGALLMALFGFMWFFALDAIRRAGHFELFYFSHLGYFAWLVLALLHGPVFWIWAGVPILGYIVERGLRVLQRARDVSIVETKPLTSHVTHVQFTRPPGWEHRAGDYLFIRVPALARYEWHPFTISSAPEQRETVGIHVRSLGNWTRALRRLAETRAALAEPGPLPAQVDGPYGTPSAHIFESRYAVLIGAGIGVTPFAAILQSILLRSRGGDGTSALEKVHFIWLSRDQRSFEWFAELLAALESDDKARDPELLDIQIYMTGARDDLKSTSLVLAREMLYARRRADVVTGLRAKTRMGRPDWEAVLTAILRQHAPSRVDVYMCGPRGLVRVLGPLCHRLGMSFRHEVF